MSGSSSNPETQNSAKVRSWDGSAADELLRNSLGGVSLPPLVDELARRAKENTGGTSRRIDEALLYRATLFTQGAIRVGMIDVQSASESYRVLQRILACAETIETALRRAEAATHITATDAAELRQEAFGRLTAFLVAILEVPESFDEYVRGEPLTLVTLRPILAHLASMPRSTILELKSHWESSFDQFASAADQFERQFSRQQLLRLFESRAPYTLKQRIQSAAASETNGLTLKPNIDRERLLNIGVLCRLAEARTEPDRNHSQPDTRSAAYAWEVFRKLAESL